MGKRRAILALIFVMSKNLKTQLAIVLAVIMAFSLVPAMAFAETALIQITDSELQSIANSDGSSERVNTGEISKQGENRSFDEFEAVKTELSPIAATTTTFKLGANVTGVLDTTTKVLTISGTGLMTKYSSSTLTPLVAGTTENNIASIVIKSGVTNIGDRVFQGLTSLKSVTIPTSVTSIGEYSFYKCSALESITIPTSVTTIKTHAFYQCAMLKSITLPSSVTTLGTYAFSECTNLTKAILSSPLTSISDYTFAECTNLTSVTIPDSVTKIGEWVFYQCTTLKTITIPNSVTSIGSYAFNACTSLESITIPNSLTSISSYMFYKCSRLTAVTLPTSMTNIGAYAFGLCTGLKSITIPNSVTSIGIYAFKGCTGLTSIDIPTSATTIAGDTFNGCSGLTTVTIPTSVTEIHTSAFTGCMGLKSIIIPASVTSISNDAFYGCSGLTSIKNLCTGKQTVGSTAFKTGAVGEKSIMAYLANTNFINVAKTAGYDVNPLDPLSSIAITTVPTKATYIEGENFDASGMVVTATCTNGGTIAVRGTVVNGSNLTAGKSSVTISYTANGTTKTTTQPITVTAKKLTLIAITTVPTKTVYTEGENFDNTGMIVTATYDAGTTKIVTGTVTNGNNLAVGTDSVTISYTEGGITKTATQAISVTAKVLSSIAITTAPTKTVYTEGENFDDTGMIVTATYTNGTTEVVSGTVTNGTALENGATSVIVSYSRNGVSKTAVQSIIVNAKEDSSSPILTTPTAGAITDTKVAITVSANDASGLAANPYLYNRNETDIGTWTNVMPYEDSGLIPNTYYTYKYKAKDSVGNESDFSEIVTVCTLAEIPVLTAQSTNGAIVLFTNDLNPSDTEYQITCGTKYVNALGQITSTPTWTTLTNKSIVITGLNQATSYNFKAKARNRTGIETEFSAVVVSTTSGGEVPSNGAVYIYDVANRLSLIKLPDGTVIEFLYDAKGNLLRTVRK